jgi:hypothetical protein
MKRRTQSGQALAIGVFLIFLLALMMYLIASFGRHVQQKIFVQTTADATALSLATMEAESLNYIAFANRAQVAQYVMAMNAQAYVSYLSWLQATAGAAQVVIPVSAVAKTLHDSIKTAIDDVADPGLEAATQAVESANQILWITEMISAEIVQAHLALGGHEFFAAIANANDPQWAKDSFSFKANAYNEAFAVYNQYRWHSAFSPAGGGPGILFPLFSKGTLQQNQDGDDTQSAERVMTEQVNATRADSFLLARGFLPFGGKLSDLLQAVTSTIKRGQSKLIDQSNVNSIFNRSPDDSDLNRGGVMASDDEWALTLGGFSIHTGGSIWAKMDGTSSHCREVGQCDSEGTDTHHKNYKGISPYMTYQAGKPGEVSQDFHQPDVFVWLYKNSSDASLPNALDFTVGTANEFNTKIGGTLGLPAGVHAIARAQAYYHRLGNWKEPPNLFNPFWRAHLAPVADGLEAASSDSNLSPTLTQVTSALATISSQTLITH